MYIVIDDISKGIDLQKPIDNRDGSKRIGLVKACLVYSFYNIKEDENIHFKNNTKIPIKKGFYTMVDIAEISKWKISYEKKTGRSIVDSTIEKFDKYLNNILGIDNSNYVDLLLSRKSFTFSASVLSTTDNLHNGIPSNNLYTGFTPKNVSFGDKIIFEPNNIQYKTMSNGIIDHIKVSLLDHDKNIINSSLPTSAVLHIV